MKLKTQLHIAGWCEPYWYLTDSLGMRHIQAISIYRCVSPDDNDVVLYGLILGPLHFCVGIGA